MSTPASRTDRAALGIWVLTRMAVMLLVLFSGWLLGRQAGFLDSWARWDVNLFTEIARYGYGGDPQEPPDPGLPAFFPGLPLLLRAVHVVVPNWTAAGLLISFVAGGVAMVAMGRLGDLEHGAGSGQRGVLALLLSPWAVFLAAGYSEALFLGFALPAWLAARRERWRAAGLLAAGASAVRITGVFLAAGLVVTYLVKTRGRVRVRDVPWLGAPFLSPLAYSAYLYARTGDWLAWMHAQQAGWGRELTWPWESFLTTWHAAVAVHNQFTWSFRAELVAAAVGVAVTIWLFATRRWGEMVYVGLQVGALVTSSYYLSIPRATLLWWPLWLLIGAWTARRPWTMWVYAAVSTPFMAVLTLVFTRGSWAG